jgi:hypothetical protein
LIMDLPDFQYLLPEDSTAYLIPDSDLNTSAFDFANLTGWMPSEGEQNMGAFRRCLGILDKYFVPVVVVIGLLGNTTSFVVFTSSFLRRYSSSVYLAALALADNGYLICIFFSWLSHVGVNLYNRDGWCHVLVYITYVSTFLSVWYVVAFSVERYIAVCYPLRRNEVCTTKRAMYVVTGLFLFSLVFYAFLPFMHGIIPIPGYPMCGPLPRYWSIVTKVNYVDTVLTFIIPVFLILGCNICITYKIINFYRNRLSGTSSPTRPRSTNHRYDIRSSSRSGSTASSSQIRVTKMMLIVSTAFLVCNLPFHALRTLTLIMSLS